MTFSAHKTHCRCGIVGHEMQAKEHTESTSKVIQKAFSPRIVGSMILQIGLCVGGLILGAVLLGKYLDTQMNSAPWITVALAVASTIPACYFAYKLGMRAVDNSQPEFSKWTEERRAAAEHDKTAAAVDRSIEEDS